MALQVRDPIHGSIQLADWAVPLVDSPVVQRLRRIQQLGTAHLVYPGARHSRFEHSLGAYHVAGRLAARLGLDADETATVQAAALLHDVGHGPFSHAFDELLREHGRRHEETTVDLVAWGPLGDILRRGGVDPVAVADAVMGRGHLAPLVSGSLDADRMDYLLRDAHYTGVRTTIDAERLIAVAVRGPKGILLDESGIVAAEGLLTTRFLMYPAVYLHHTVRASEAMLQRAIRLHVDGAGAERLTRIHLDTDDALLARLRASGGPVAQLIERLDERRLWKRAFEGGPERADDPAVQRLHDATAREEAAAEIADEAGVPRHEVAIDVPHAPRFRELELRVLLRDGATVPLAERSSLVRVLGEARLDHWRFWVFCPRRHIEAVRRVATERFGPVHTA